MRRTAVVAIALLLLVLVLERAHAEQVTVTGQVIDLACYIVDKSNIGNAHKGKGKNCARACAAEGFAVGVLTADGKVYHLTGDLSSHSNAKLISHMGQTVAITGEVKNENGQLTLVGTGLSEQGHE
jgi:hypothetical protein